MAYTFFIAAIKPDIYASFKTAIDSLNITTDKNSLPSLSVEKSIVTTHYYLSFGTGYEVLNLAMAELLEAGQKINDVFWHPYRPPLYQDHLIVKPKSQLFKIAYEDMLAKLDKKDAEFWHMDFEPIINLLDFAVENNLSLLTFLAKPNDKERADKVYYPTNIQID